MVNGIPSQITKLQKTDGESSFFHLYKRTAMAMTFGTLLLSTYSNEWRRNRPAELKCQTFHGGGAPASDTHLIVFPSSSSET